MNNKMFIKDLSCTFNMPKKVEFEKKDGEEKVNSLPPYNPVKPYLVNDYKNCPSNWINGSEISNSYFLGVKEDHGMWLDFNDCHNHSKDVAIVISIQGINPITGIKTSKLRLEQYSDKCPVHDVQLDSKRFCSKCEYEWPPQNYLSTTSTPSGLLWLDGFRTPEGNVRQYLFTSQEMKGIANQIIGEDRTFSIGIAFYESKKEKQKLNWNYLNWDWQDNTYFPNRPILYGTGYKGYHEYNEGDAITPNFLYSNNTRSISCSNFSQKENKPIEAQNLEIGAGSLIKQEVYQDNNDLNYWEEKPYGLIYVNYCDEKTLENILKEGKKEEKINGFMNNLNLNI